MGQHCCVSQEIQLPHASSHPTCQPSHNNDSATDKNYEIKYSESNPHTSQQKPHPPDVIVGLDTYPNFNPQNFFFPCGDKLVHGADDCNVWYEYTHRQDIKTALKESKMIQEYLLCIDGLIDIICDYTYDNDDYLTLIRPFIPVQISPFFHHKFNAQYKMTKSTDNMIQYAIVTDLDADNWERRYSEFAESMYIMLNNNMQVFNDDFNNQNCVYQYCFKTYCKLGKVCPQVSLVKYNIGSSIDGSEPSDTDLRFRIGIFLLNINNENNVIDKHGYNDSCNPKIVVSNTYFAWEWESILYASGRKAKDVNIVEYYGGSVRNNEIKHKRFNVCYGTIDGNNQSYDLFEKNEYLLFEIDLNEKK